MKFETYDGSGGHCANFGCVHELEPGDRAIRIQASFGEVWCCSNPCAKQFMSDDAGEELE